MSLFEMVQKNLEEYRNTEIQRELRKKEMAKTEAEKIVTNMSGIVSNEILKASSQGKLSVDVLLCKGPHFNENGDAFSMSELCPHLVNEFNKFLNGDQSNFRLKVYLEDETFCKLSVRWPSNQQKTQTEAIQDLLDITLSLMGKNLGKI